MLWSIKTEDLDLGRIVVIVIGEEQKGLRVSSGSEVGTLVALAMVDPA